MSHGLLSTTNLLHLLIILLLLCLTNPRPTLAQSTGRPTQRTFVILDPPMTTKTLTTTLASTWTIPVERRLSTTTFFTLVASAIPYTTITTTILPPEETEVPSATIGSIRLTSSIVSRDNGADVTGVDSTDEGGGGGNGGDGRPTVTVTMAPSGGGNGSLPGDGGSGARAAGDGEKEAERRKRELLIATSLCAVLGTLLLMGLVAYVVRATHRRRKADRMLLVAGGGKKGMGSDELEGGYYCEHQRQDSEDSGWVVSPPIGGHSPRMGNGGVGGGGGHPHVQTSHNPSRVSSPHVGTTGVGPGEFKPETTRTGTNLWGLVLSKLVGRSRQRSEAGKQRAVVPVIEMDAGYFAYEEMDGRPASRRTVIAKSFKGHVAAASRGVGSRPGTAMGSRPGTPGSMVTNVHTGAGGRPGTAATEGRRTPPPVPVRHLGGPIIGPDESLGVFRERPEMTMREGSSGIGGIGGMSGGPGGSSNALASTTTTHGNRSRNGTDNGNTHPGGKVNLNFTFKPSRESPDPSSSRDHLPTQNGPQRMQHLQMEAMREEREGNSGSPPPPRVPPKTMPKTVIRYVPLAGAGARDAVIHRKPVQTVGAGGGGGGGAGAAGPGGSRSNDRPPATMVRGVEISWPVPVVVRTQSRRGQ